MIQALPQQEKQDELRQAHWLARKENRTDNYLAELFIDKAGHLVRYVPEWRKWLVWDGKRWAVDIAGTRVLRGGREFASHLWLAVTDCGRHPLSDGEDVKHAATFVKAANKQRGIESFIELAKADKRIEAKVEQLNADPLLLNVQNGTVDLRTGEIREHRRDDLITQIAAVDYEPGAPCPRWVEACELIFQGDPELIAFVQQVLGYSLSGDTGEHMLPIAYGDGCNGKSFLWNTILGLAGDYGTLAHDSLLLGDKHAHPTEKASLYQKRIVAISEPEQGARMRESRIKELTGDDTITARRMREDFWTFGRTHTFWLSTNHLPKVSGQDEGIWRRIKLIPFSVNLKEKVKPIPDFHKVLVREEGAGILGWLIDGYRSYQRHGLIDPEAVRNAVAGYRDDQDHLGEFIDECCTVGEGCIGPAKELFDAYQQWGGKWSKTGFGNALAQRFEKEKPTGGEHRRKVIYHGIEVAKF